MTWESNHGEGTQRDKRTRIPPLFDNAEWHGLLVLWLDTCGTSSRIPPALNLMYMLSCENKQNSNEGPTRSRTNGSGVDVTSVLGGAGVGAGSGTGVGVAAVGFAPPAGFEPGFAAGAGAAGAGAKAGVGAGAATGAALFAADAVLSTVVTG